MPNSDIDTPLLTLLLTSYDTRGYLYNRSLASLCPVPTVANVENNELRIENNAISGHILLALFSSRRALLSIFLPLVSHY